MKIKNQALYRSIVIIAIAFLSVLCGIIYQAVHKKMELSRYPKDYSEYVEKYAEEFSVPEYVIYGVIKYESSFASNNVKDNGAIGLMGVSEEELDTMLRITKETLTKDTLYGPETNIKYGIHWLSYEYSQYDNWDLVLLAKVVGTDTVDVWLSDDSVTDNKGRLKSVPDAEASAELKKLKNICEKYRDLYYGK